MKFMASFFQNVFLFFVGLFSFNGERKTIIPEGDVVKNSLIFVIAIMTFLSALAFGGARFINEAAKHWQNHLVQEALIQIDPSEEGDIEFLLTKAARIAQKFPFVRSVQIVNQKETEALLEPWLGKDVDIKVLPLPRLIIIEFFKDAALDVEALKNAITDSVKSAHFYNYQSWIQHIVHISYISNFFAFMIIFLLFAVSSLTIIVATRAAISTNSDIVEILYFIGTDNQFIARQFDIHFFQIALKGAVYGGGIALALFFGLFFWGEYFFTTLANKQIFTFLGAIYFDGYDAISLLVLIFAIALLTMFTSHKMIVKQLKKLENY